MFLLVGLIFIAGLILYTLYYFVFKRIHHVLSYILLFIVSFLLILTGFMHAILAGIIILCGGIFTIHFVKKNNVKNIG